MALGLAANLVESLSEPNKKTNVGEKFVTGLVKSVSSLAKDINFLSGMSDVVNDIEGAFEGTESKKTALGGIAASELVPGVVRDTAHIVDSTVRKPTSVREQFETQIPGLSTRVPAKTDISGKPIQRDVRNLGGFNPYTVSQETTDETTKEQARLAQLPPKPSRLELAGIASATPREQTQLNAQEALMLHDRLAELQKQGVLNGMSDDNKQRLISRVKSVIAKSRNARLLELRKQSSGPQFDPAWSSRPTVNQVSTRINHTNKGITMSHRSAVFEPSNTTPRDGKGPKPETQKASLPDRYTLNEQLAVGFARGLGFDPSGRTPQPRHSAVHEGTERSSTSPKPIDVAK